MAATGIAATSASHTMTVNCLSSAPVRRAATLVVSSSTGARTDWNFTFSITNQDTAATVFTKTFTNCALAQNVHDNAVTWRDNRDPQNPNRLEIWQHDGIRVYLNATPLENTSAFAAHKDTDEDGMSDAWEDTHALNKNSAADAALDGDADGLTNLREFLAGTSPTDADSDDDAARDGIEVIHRKLVLDLRHHLGRPGLMSDACPQHRHVRWIPHKGQGDEVHAQL
jgi:hypothetical protein